METTPSRLLPLNIVARRLRVPLRWLKAEAEAGRIPCLIAAGRILCDLYAVEAALLERATPRKRKLYEDKPTGGAK